MAATARGLICPDGREPALTASTRPPPWRRAKASAIWLRLLFSTQTKRTRFGRSPVMAGSLASAGLEGIDLHAGGVVVDVVAAKQIGEAAVDVRLRFGRPAAGVR